MPSSAVFHMLRNPALSVWESIDYFCLFCLYRRLDFVSIKFLVSWRVARQLCSQMSTWTQTTENSGTKMLKVRNTCYFQKVDQKVESIVIYPTQYKAVGLNSVLCFIFNFGIEVLSAGLNYAYAIPRMMLLAYAPVCSQGYFSL